METTSKTKRGRQHDGAGVQWVTVQEVVVARRLLGLERVVTYPMEVAQLVTCDVCGAERGVMCRFMPFMGNRGAGWEPGLLVHAGRRVKAIRPGVHANGMVQR